MSEKNNGTANLDLDKDKIELMLKQQKNVDELLEWYEKKDLGLI